MSDTEAPTMADASAAASARLDSMGASGPPETPPPETPETTPETEPTPVAPPEPQGWKAPEFWEEEFDGARHRLSPQEVSYMLRSYHAAAKRAAQAARERDGQAPQGQAPSGAQGGQPQNPYEERIAKLEKMLGDVNGNLEARESQEREAKLERDSRDAVAKDPILSKLKGTRMRERAVGYTMLEQLYNPTLSLAEAAKRVAADLDEEFRHVRGGYVTEKVESAKNPVESVGTTSAPSKKLEAKDLKNGGVMKRAMARVERMLSQ